MKTIAILAVLICISFFLPWVHVESQVVGGLARIFTGTRQPTLTTISGFDVPGLANGPDARMMISVIEIFNPGITDADRKSWFVWGSPLLAIAIALLSLITGRKKWFDLSLAIIGILIFIMGVYKIKAADLDKVVLNVKIGRGLWLTLYGYLGLGIVGALGFLKGLNKSGK